MTYLAVENESTHATELKLIDGCSIDGNTCGFAGYWTGDGDRVPYGYVLLDGSEVGKEAYADLYAVIGDRFSDGTEQEGNFRLPNVDPLVSGGVQMKAIAKYTPLYGDVVCTQETQPERPVVYAFSGSNKKSILFKEGSAFHLKSSTLRFKRDTVIDLSGQITRAANVDTKRSGQINGKLFNIFMTAEKDIVISTKPDVPNDISNTYTRQNTVWIGCFSTLCAAVAANSTAKIPMARGSATVGNSFLVKPGYADDDYGFKTFYTKNISAKTTGTYYDVATVPHVLAGFAEGDILPESVWCLGFRPTAKSSVNMNNVLGMVYDADFDLAYDIYLQSGTGQNTSSMYGETHTVSRCQPNHQDDMRQVGKKLLSDDEFMSAAAGSNECTNVEGSTDKGTVGGHVDTNGQRMVSFIGCEECCGYLWQWLRDTAGLGTGTAHSNISGSGQNVGNTGWITADGQNAFGLMYNAITAVLAGGNWDDGACCGSRSRVGNYARSLVRTLGGGRGVCRVTRRP